MNALASKQDVGDYDLRGQDFETTLVGAVTTTIIDSDAYVRDEWRGEHFENATNWALYRVALAKDSHLRDFLHKRCDEFAAACMVRFVAERNWSRTLFEAAGHDVFARLTTTHWAGSGAVYADACGVGAETYRKLRLRVFKALQASLDEYWIRLQVAIRQVVLLERRTPTAVEPCRYSDGRGFGEIDVTGDGNYRAFPKGSGC